ncbi:EspA/EspE family type VII secretion system effector [Mycolicibacterium goodii]
MGAFGDFYDMANNWYSGYSHTVGVAEDTRYTVAGLGADVISSGQSIAREGAQKLGDTRLAAAAATPIIAYGLRAMTIMSNLTGFEGPERGDRYGRGAEAFSEVSGNHDATGSPDSWEGTGSQAYSDRNREQKDRAELMAETDRIVKEVLDKEAGEIEDTRRQIDHQVTELTWLIPAAIAAKFWNAPPGSGEIASQIIQWGGVAKTLPIATQRMYRMIADSSENATVIRRAGATYDRIAAEAQAQ